MMPRTTNVVVDPSELSRVSNDLEQLGVRRMRGLISQERSTRVPILGIKDTIRSKEWGKSVGYRELAFSMWDDSVSAYTKCDIMVSGRGMLLPIFNLANSGALVSDPNVRMSQFGKKTVPSKFEIRFNELNP